MAPSSHSAASYDYSPYESKPFDQTHPSRFGAASRLYGITSPDVTHCRVLELGCSTGGNLLGMAMNLPAASLVGIDLSSSQIEKARASAAALAIPNVQFYAMSVTDIGADFGQFDYIIAHGLYSWVPDDVQSAILNVCKEHLSSNGLAYISYNTYPGWHLRGMVREIMLYHSQRYSSPHEQVQQCRGIVDFLVQSVPNAQSAYGAALRAEAELLRKNPDYYVLHEQLADVNRPCYFHEFATRLETHGLRYVTDALLQTADFNELPMQVLEPLRRVARDATELEQYVDFARGRLFRCSVVARAEVQNLSCTLDALDDLYVSSLAKPISDAVNIASPEIEETFRTKDGNTINTQQPLTKAAMMVLAQAAPRPLIYRELRDLSWARLQQCGTQSGRNQADAELRLKNDLARCCATGLVALYTFVPPLTTAVSSHPQVHPAMRAHAQRHDWIISQVHSLVLLDEFARKLVPLLDGTRDRKQLLTEMHSLVRQGVLPYIENGQVITDDARILAALELAINKTVVSLSAGATLLS